MIRHEVHPSKVQPGDVILGGLGTVAAVHFGTMCERGSDEERARWFVVTTNGATFPYAGDSTVSVLRKG